MSSKKPTNATNATTNATNATKPGPSKSTTHYTSNGFTASGFGMKLHQKQKGPHAKGGKRSKCRSSQKRQRQQRRMTHRRR